MPKYLIKTILSPVILILVLFTVMFSVSAETSEELIVLENSVIDNKKISTSDEKIVPNDEVNTLPTMKPAYYNAVNSQTDEEKQIQDINKTFNENNLNTLNETEKTFSSADEKVSKSVNDTESDRSTADTVNSTFDTATMDETTTKGVVSTGDTSVSIFVLLGLISLTSLLIGIHKKQITE